MDMRIEKSTALLAAIIVVGFAIRLLFIKEEYLYVNDPYFHYSNFLSILHGGSTALNYPQERYLPVRAVHLLLGPFLSPYDAFRLTAPIFGVLTIVPVYLLTKRTLGQREAIISSAILAFLPAFIHRTIAGNYRGDPFAMFFVAWGFYFFLARGRVDRKLSIYALSAALSFTLAGAVWSSGYIFAMVILTAFVIINTLFSLYKGGARGYLVSYAISTGGSALFLQLLLNGGIIHRLPLAYEDFVTVFLPTGIFFPALVEGFGRATSSWGARMRAIVGGLAVAILLGIFLYKFSGLLGELVTLYGKTSTLTGGVRGTVSEVQPLDMGGYWTNFHMVGLLFVPGLLFLLRNYSPRRIFVALWVLVSFLVVYIAGIRGTFTLSLPMAVVAALGISRLLFHEKITAFRQHPAFPKVLLFFLLLFVGNAGVAYADGLTPMITDNWVDALEWTEENTPGNATVLSWWDYGYWIMGLGDRKPVATPGLKERSEELARMFIEGDATRVRKVMERYGAEYIIAPTDMVLQMHNLEKILDVENHHYITFNYSGQGTVGSKDIPARVYGNTLYVAKDSKGYAGFIKKGGTLQPVKLVYYVGEERVVRKFEDTYPGTFYYPRGDFYLPLVEVEEFVIYIPPNLEDSFLTSLLFYRGEGYPVEKIYSNPQINIYRYRG